MEDTPVRFPVHNALSLAVVFREYPVPHLQIDVVEPLIYLLIGNTMLLLVSTLFDCLASPIMKAMFAFRLWYQPGRMTNYLRRFARITCQSC